MEEVGVVLEKRSAGVLKNRLNDSNAPPLQLKNRVNLEYKNISRPVKKSSLR